MALRTYLPALVKILRATCKYMKRWEIQIRAQLPAGAAQDAFTATLLACAALEDIVSALIPPAT